MILESKNLIRQHILDLVNTYLSRLGGFKLTMCEKLRNTLFHLQMRGSKLQASDFTFNFKKNKRRRIVESAETDHFILAHPSPYSLYISLFFSYFTTSEY